MLKNYIHLKTPSQTVRLVLPSFHCFRMLLCSIIESFFQNYYTEIAIQTDINDELAKPDDQNVELIFTQEDFDELFQLQQLIEEDMSSTKSTVSNTESDPGEIASFFS